MPERSGGSGSLVKLLLAVLSLNVLGASPYSQ